MNATPALIALPDATDTAACGAKAATLARLTRAGLPVPDGIVVPAGWPTDRLAALIPDLLQWAETRGAPALIARSSTPAEDGTSASFAGMYASAFTPATPDLLLAALQQVRSSVYAPDIPAYARRAGVGASTTIAILIQPALRPHAAGVAALEGLPAQPAGRVEAVWGLAEPLASGRRTGEIHVLSGGGSTLVIPGDQPEIMLPCTAADLVLPPGEWTTIDPPDAAPTPAKIHLSERNLLRLYTPANWSAPILAADHIQRVTALAIAAAGHLHLDRIDIEWALLPDGQLHLLQARPLTAPLPPTPQALTQARSGIRQGIPAVAGTGTGPAVHLAGSALPHLSSDDIRASVIICDTLGPEAVHVLCHRPAALIAAH
ncbi:PEP/pyruvate-binding domain-containing protein, partial [Nonomuraea sp. NPDC049695]|uniref:PEP/pyruvate-binding domain-containing protein n=1 Tax=Nonomuraea sp. NPDC049695 TaxID=3154734 RepID=UPI00344A57A5